MTATRPGATLHGAARPAWPVADALSLPWQDQPCWRVLQAGDDGGAAFLDAWEAWSRDPRRPHLLHWVVVGREASAGTGCHRRAPPRGDKAAQLAGASWGLVPGFHRLSFEGGRVLLTVCVGQWHAQLAELAFAADTILADLGALGAAPDPALAKALARCCRPGTHLVLPATDADPWPHFTACGFVPAPLRFSAGAARVPANAVFAPAWTLRQAPSPPSFHAPATALVVGGGLAGAAAAASLARRGWTVTVLDAAARPASGASALPAGLLAPHTSTDDGLLSRLTRAGVRMTLGEARHLEQGADWSPTGVLERRPGPVRRLPVLGPAGNAWQRWADADRRAIWHEAGAWIKPAALVQHWLAHPGITWHGLQRIDRLQRTADGWQALDAHGSVKGQAALVVVAAALGSVPLLGTAAPILQPVRGQVSWGPVPQDGLGPLEPGPVNGNGHLLPSVPQEGVATWLSGSTYGHADSGTDLRDEDQAANLERLSVLSADAARRLEAGFSAGTVRAWAGVRCASTDRRPLVGQVQPGLWVSTAMGSRGLSFAALCGELLAARLHAEPLPVEARLAAALDVQRQRPRQG